MGQRLEDGEWESHLGIFGGVFQADGRATLKDRTVISMSQKYERKLRV